MNEYLAFAKQINESTYELDFCKDTDIVWGENWNICPTSIVPDIDVDSNCISSFIYFKSEKKIDLAKYNPCFSMQDCIDGIFPLIFTNLEENSIMFEGKPFFLSFGENKEEVKDKLKKFNLEIIKEENTKDKSEEILDNLMNDLDNINNNSDDNLDF